MYIGNVMLLVLNLPLVGLFIRVLLVPRWVLVPSVAVIGYVAVYSVSGSVFDLMVMTALGVLGYLMRKMNFPVAPVILALVLGPLMETNLRRALSLAQGNPSVLVGSPITIVLWLMVAASVLLPILTRRSPVAELGPAAASREDEDAPPLND